MFISLRRWVSASSGAWPGWPGPAASVAAYEGLGLAQAAPAVAWVVWPTAGNGRGRAQTWRSVGRPVSVILRQTVAAGRRSLLSIWRDFVSNSRGARRTLKTSNTVVKWRKPRKNRAPARGRLTGVLRVRILFGEVVGVQRNPSRRVNSSHLVPAPPMPPATDRSIRVAFRLLI